MDDTQITIFRREGVDIPILSIDGEPWFIAGNVARVLGYRMASDMTRRLDDDERGTHSMRTPGGEQTVTVISEAGLYSAILGSRVPDAKDFKRWITHEVLPSIRRTGSYAVVEVARALPQNFAEALRELASEFESHEATKAVLAETTPRAEAWDAIASASGDYAVGDAAKILVRAGIPTGPQRLFQQLADIKWSFRAPDGKWRAYADRVEKGYLSERPQFHYHPNTGERVVDPPQLRVTVKGLERLRQRLHVGALQAVTA